MKNIQNKIILSVLYKKKPDTATKMTNQTICLNKITN